MLTNDAILIEISGRQARTRELLASIELPLALEAIVASLGEPQAAMVATLASDIVEQFPLWAHAMEGEPLVGACFEWTWPNDAPIRSYGYMYIKSEPTAEHTEHHLARLGYQADRKIDGQVSFDGGGLSIMEWGVLERLSRDREHFAENALALALVDNLVELELLRILQEAASVAFASPVFEALPTAPTFYLMARRANAPGFVFAVIRSGADGEEAPKPGVDAAHLASRGDSTFGSPTAAWDLLRDADGADGWFCGDAPAIGTNRWPRSRRNGMPMLHVVTTRVPDEYRTRGQNLVAIAMFQADDHIAPPIEGVQQAFAADGAESEGEFWSALSAHIRDPHPNQTYAVDGIGGGWAWIWLTEEEFASRTSPPDPACRPVDYRSFDGLNAWAHASPAVPFSFVQRADDPNVGKAPGSSESGYIAMFSEEGERLDLERFFGSIAHFGGTAIAALSAGPSYFEWGDLLGGNLGGGTAWLDLTTNQLMWEC